VRPSATVLPRNRNIWAAAISLALVSAGLCLAGVAQFGWLGAQDARATDASLDVGAVMSAFKTERRQWIRRRMSTRKVLGVPRSELDSIAACESHGNPRSIGGGGLYRGKYQFDRGTWASVGGKGDPARAPEYEQDERAAMLLKRSGTSPWPVCG
jgi:hypothetical protein